MIKVIRYFKDEKLVEEKVGYGNCEPTTTKKIHYVDIPDGSSIVIETYYNTEGETSIERKYNSKGVLMSERTTYQTGSFCESFFNNKGQIVKTLSVSGNVCTSMESWDYDEHGNMLLNVHYIMDNGTIHRKDVWRYINIYTDHTTEGSLDIVDEDDTVCTCICAFDSKCRCIKREFDTGTVEILNYDGNLCHIRGYNNGILMSETSKKTCDGTCEEYSRAYDYSGDKIVSTTRKVTNNRAVTLFGYSDIDGKHTRTEYEYDEHGNVATIKINGVVEKKFMNIYE